MEIAFILLKAINAMKLMTGCSMNYICTCHFVFEFCSALWCTFFFQISNLFL